MIVNTKEYAEALSWLGNESGNIGFMSLQGQQHTKLLETMRDIIIYQAVRIQILEDAHPKLRDSTKSPYDASINRFKP